MPQTPHHLPLVGIHRENKGLFSQRLTLRHKRHATSLRKCRVCLVPMGARLLPICSVYGNVYTYAICHTWSINMGYIVTKMIYHDSLEKMLQSFWLQQMQYNGTFTLKRTENCFKQKYPGTRNHLNVDAKITWVRCQHYHSTSQHPVKWGSLHVWG